MRKGIDLLEIAFAQDAGTFAATSEYDAKGSVTSIDWIRHNCRFSGHFSGRVVSIESGMTTEKRATSVL